MLQEIGLPSYEQFRQVINALADDKLIYGVIYDKQAKTVLTPTDAAVGMMADVGVDGELVRNDFDNAPIFREIGKVKDELGNVFVRLPKFYIRRREGKRFLLVQISKTKYPGFYLPMCLWDFENKQELPYFDFGAHKASLGEGNALESKPNKHPHTLAHIVNFRTYAKNNNKDGQKGYQQHDAHAQDMLEALVMIEFGTLDVQTLMRGFTNGRYTADKAVVAETNTNRVIVTNAVGINYLAGQSIGIGSVYSTNSISGTPRQITKIEDYDANNKAIYFDGDPIDIEIGNELSNRAYKTGFSTDVAASSGSIVDNASGKYPCVYRGIESPWGDLYEFMDGVNINDHQAWVCKNAEQYASNVFAAPYEKLSYINHGTSGYITEMGYDEDHPYLRLPTAVGGSATTYYSDYYYQATGARIARVSGYWVSSAGPRYGLFIRNLSFSSSSADVDMGGRLHKKALGV